MRKMVSQCTLPRSIYHLHEARAVVHYKLFAVGIFYRWIVRLREVYLATHIAIMSDQTMIPLRGRVGVSM
jgi:hypothetical protein